MTTVTLSLISHTNVGKTTLARTILRRDVGEVLDQAHVTEVSEAYPLLETDEARLRLWDTPGFGDTGRLMRRLRHERDPLGWFLHQVWDRLVDRPLWCGQEAVRNIKDEADVVLYLVNAAEEPEGAGYVPLELELLGWMDRPVMLLLNQTGNDPAPETRWREFAARCPIVRDVLSLDAFTRCWVEEDVLFHRVARLLDGERSRAMEALAAGWNDRNVAVFRTSCRRIAGYLAAIALDRESAGEAAGARGLVSSVLEWSGIDKKRTTAALSHRLDRATSSLMESLIADHGLEGTSEATIEERIREFQVRGRPRFDERSGAVAGAVVTGALGGLAADVLSGGLSLGGGMIAGGILGALGGSALAHGFRLVGRTGPPTVRWSTEFLDRLAGQALLRYLAVAHFGRGRGRYRDLELPAHWSEAVEGALAAQRDALRESWLLAEEIDSAAPAKLEERLARIVEDAARAVLRGAYPHAAALLS